MTADSDSTTDSPPVPPSKRTDRRPRDMVLSLVVLLVPILLMFVGWRYVSSDDVVTGIDPAESYSEAGTLGLQVREPADLADGWVPVSHAVNQSGETVTLRVGYSTPDGGGAQLVQSDEDAERLLAGELGEAPRAEGSVDVDGTQWQRYTTIEGNTAIVLSDDDMTYLAHGDGDAAELTELAGALD